MSDPLTDDDLQKKFFDAVCEGRVEALPGLLARGADPAYAGFNGLTPLANAVFLGQKGAFDVLMKDARAVATINEKIFVRNSKTVLSLAVLYCHPYMVEQLVKAGADVNAPDSNGKTPLYMAIDKGNPEMVRWLAEAGADVDRTSEWADGPPLHHAVGARKEIEIMKILVDHGADINARDYFGYTLAHLAVMYPVTQEEVLDFFVAAGGDLTLKSNNGRTAYDMANRLNDGAAMDKIFWLLKREGKDVSSLPLPGGPTSWDRFI